MRVGGENHAPLCRRKGGVRVGDGSYLKPAESLSES